MEKVREVDLMGVRNTVKKVSKREVLYLEYLRMLEDHYGTQMINPLSVYTCLKSACEEALKQWVAFSQGDHK